MPTEEKQTGRLKQTGRRRGSRLGVVRANWLEEFKAEALKLLDHASKVTLAYPAAGIAKVNIICYLGNVEQRSAAEKMVALLNEQALADE